MHEPSQIVEKFSNYPEAKYKFLKACNDEITTQLLEGILMFNICRGF
jgi:hypothetical protein